MNRQTSRLKEKQSPIWTTNNESLHRIDIICNITSFRLNNNNNNKLPDGISLPKIEQAVCRLKKIEVQGSP